MLVVPQTILAPQAITIVFSTPTFGVDLSTVTAVALSVVRRDGTTATWTMTIASAVPGELVAQYAPSSGDITGTGVYTLAPRLTVPGGTVAANAVAMMVEPAGLTSANLSEASWVVPSVQIASLGPTKNTWTEVVAPVAYSAIPTSPWLAVDLRSGTATVTLWAGQPGDMVALSDVYRAIAPGASLKVVAAAGQTVPLATTGYASSATYTAAGFPSRLKLDASGAWFPW